MKLRNLSPVVLSVAALCVSALSLNAVTTTPVGAVAQDIVAGSQVLSVPFQEPISYQGVTTSVSGAVLGLASVPALPTPAYVQVLSGVAEGAIATISASDAASVTVGSVIPGIAVGDVVAIRKHVTFDKIGAFISAQEGDVLTVFNPDGSSVSGEYFGGFGWYDEAGDALADEMPVYPGEGFVLVAAAARTATYYGTVSANAVNVSYPALKISLVGTLDPVAGQSIGSALPVPTEGAVITFYENIGGALKSTFGAEYFDGFGFYDEANDLLADNYIIGSGKSVVLLSPSAGAAQLAPAYTE